MRLEPVIHCPLESGLIIHLGYVRGSLFQLDMVLGKYEIAKGTNNTGNIFKRLRVRPSMTVVGDENILSRDGLICYVRSYNK